jgi:hypothetical protein
MLEKNSTLVLAIIFLFHFTGFAQVDSSKVSPTALKMEFMQPDAGIYYDWETNSNGLTNKFLFSVNKDNTISNDIKNSTATKLRAVNHYIAHTSGGGYYVMPLKAHAGLGLVFELEGVSHQDATFSKDAYELMLFGNAHYKNQKKEFGNLFFRNISYQRIGLGLQKYFAHQSQCFTASLNFILGDYFNEVRISRGSLFTEQYGEYLDIDLAYERHFAAIGKSDYSPRGYGSSLNLDWKKLWVEKKALLEVNIKDLGMIHYPARTPHHTIDTTVHFTGVDFGSFSSFSSSGDMNLNDTLVKYFNMKKKDEVYNFMMPLSASIKFEKTLKNSDIAQARLNLYLYNSLPQLTLGYLHQLKPGLLLGADLRIGGYGLMDIDLNARYHHKKMFFEMSVKSIEGLILPKSASGMGLFAHLGYFLD